MIWIRRQRYYIDYALSSLLRRKGRNLALTGAYTLVIFAIASVLFFSNALRRDAEALLSAAPAITVQRIMAGRHDLIPTSYGEAISRIRGVRSVAGRLWGYYFHPASGANYTVMGERDFPHGDDQAVVGNGVMRTWGSMPDGKLYLQTHDGNVLALNVARILPPEAELVSADLILMSETAFRTLTGMPPGFAADLAVEIGNERESITIAEKITRIFPDARPILREEILRTYAAVFSLRGGYGILLLSGAVLAFFIFAWDRAAGLSAEERMEIGVLKAVGWDTGDILILKCWEGGVVSLTAFLLGVLLAHLHIFAGNGYLLEHAMRGWSVLHPRFNLTPAVDGFQMATLFFLTVVPYSAVALIPVWKAAIADPDAVMR